VHTININDIAEKNPQKQLEGTQAKTNERGHNKLLSCKVPDHYLNHEWQ
jgi:hypothetical protein